jgi:hypothetical protein
LPFVLIITSPPAVLGHKRFLLWGAICFEWCPCWLVSVVAWWDLVWPPAALAVSLAVNVAWLGLLGYGLARLL